MTIRVTQNSTSALMIQDIDSSYAQYESLSAEAASGLAITQPSDNPAGTVQAIAYNAQITRLGQYQTNASDGLAWLGTAQNTLSGVVTQVQQVQQLVEQAANSTTDASGRAAIADQVTTIQQTLLADANTTYLGRPIFGGTTGGSVAYDSTGTYVGDQGAVTRTVADGTTVQVNVTGTQAFGSGSSSLFSVMSQIVSDLTSSNPTQTANLGSSDLTAIGGVLSTVQTAEAKVGSNYAELQTLQNQAQSRQATVTTSLSNVQDADMAKVETDLNIQQMTYQAAIEATSKISSLSLATFLA